jgi:hypothetical protein
MLRLTSSPVLLGAFVTPDFSPKNPTQMLEVLPVRRRRPLGLLESHVSLTEVEQY